MRNQDIVNDEKLHVMKFTVSWIWIALITEFHKHFNSRKRLKFHKEGLNIITLHQ
jgi:hypothetical protein